MCIRSLICATTISRYSKSQRRLRLIFFYCWTCYNIRLRWFGPELCVCWTKSIPPSRTFIQSAKAFLTTK
uniref:Secreted protein n=1 Tax=Bursaphelenchus xylophilus TaxID=6326 RepID=A0A1I7SE30_BURXY